MQGPDVVAKNIILRTVFYFFRELFLFIDFRSFELSLGRDGIISCWLTI